MSDPTTSAVLSTTLTVAVSANTLFNLAIGWVTWSLRAGAAKVTRLEEKLDRTERERDAKHHEMTDKLIDTRIQNFTHQIKDVMNKVEATAHAQATFVVDVDRQIERLGDKDHQAELQVLREIKELQVKLAREGVTKEDLRRHEEAVQRQLDDIKRRAGC